MTIDPCLFLDQMSRVYRAVLRELEGLHGTPIRVQRHGLSLLLHFDAPEGERGDTEIIVEIEPDATADTLRIEAVISSPGEDCRQLYVRQVGIDTPSQLSIVAST